MCQPGRPLYLLPALNFLLPAADAADVVAMMEDESWSAWSVSWVQDETGELSSAIELTPLPDAKYDYWVHGWYRLGEMDLEWWDGPWAATDPAAITVDLALPDSIWVSELQATALGLLVVRVEVWDGDRRVDAQYAPAARVFWPDGPEAEPWILSRQEARLLAPWGVVGLELELADGEIPTGEPPADVVTP